MPGASAEWTTTATVITGDIDRYHFEADGYPDEFLPYLSGHWCTLDLRERRATLTLLDAGPTDEVALAMATTDFSLNPVAVAGAGSPTVSVSSFGSGSCYDIEVVVVGVLVESIVTYTLTFE